MTPWTPNICMQYRWPRSPLNLFLLIPIQPSGTGVGVTNDCYNRIVCSRSQPRQCDNVVAHPRCRRRHILNKTLHENNEDAGLVLSLRESSISIHYAFGYDLLRFSFPCAFEHRTGEHIIVEHWRVIFSSRSEPAILCAEWRHSVYIIPRMLRNIRNATHPWQFLLGVSRGVVAKLRFAWLD